VVPVRRTRSAEQDLLELVERIAVDRPRTAQRFLARVDRTVAMIASMPECGRPRDNFGTGVRSVPVGNYVLFYRPEHDGITILRVLHGSRRLEDLL